MTWPRCVAVSLGHVGPVYLHCNMLIALGFPSRISSCRAESYQSVSRRKRGDAIRGQNSKHVAYMALLREHFLVKSYDPQQGEKLLSASLCGVHPPARKHRRVVCLSALRGQFDR